jgi:hypothetical protein
MRSGAREREVEVERKRVEVEQRKAAVAEENARIGWRKVELLAGGATTKKLLRGQVVSAEVLEAGAEKDGKDNKDEREAGGEMKLLPFLQAVLGEEGVSAEEKLARLQAVLALGATEQKLLEIGGDER